MSEKQILVVSFSPIHRDARVLRQLSAVREFGHVTTVGYGTTPEGSDEHLQVPDDAPSLPQTIPGVAKLALRRLRAAELAAPASQAALRLVGDRRFDAVIANDARALPVAFALAHGAPVWADMHEWAPEERTHVLSWRLLVAPLMDHDCREYLPRAAAVTTVGTSIVDLYRERYGVTPRLVRNAAPFAELEPTRVPEDGTIRLVHSGGAVPGRNIDGMIRAVLESEERFTLDLFLVAANDGGRYLRELRDIAGNSPRIRFNDPVRPHELAAALNQFDVGIYWIPPTNTNARLALPNKLFDFIQGRLAIAVGPTMEMQRIVEEYGLGVVSKGFETADIVETLNSLTSDDVMRYKEASHRAAPEISFEREAETVGTIMREMLG